MDLVVPIGGLEALAQCHSLGRNDVHQGAALLPGEIPAATTVTVKYEGSASAAVYNLVSEEGSISIKPSTMTTVRFNGIKDGFREVRYAGFPNDSVVDVAPDVWE